MLIRAVCPSDAKALLGIYAPYVRETAISFEYVVPTKLEFEDRIRRITEKYPYLLAQEGGKILGYCYADVFHAREAYDHSVEISIYVERSQKKHGVGKKLYRALEEALTAKGIKNLYACIAYPPKDDDPYLTKDSVSFHEKMGFALCGHFHGCGYKFDRWYDMVYMEKRI